MAYQFLCPQCLRKSNTLLSAPPVQPVATCVHCGHKYLRSAASFANAWANSFTVFTAATVFLGFVVFSADFEQGPANFLIVAVGGLILGLLLAIPGRMIGWLVGAGVGLSVGGSWETPVIDAANLPKMRAPVSLPPAAEGLDAVRVGTSARLSSTMRCWHCGHVFEIRDKQVGSSVRCPGCKAGLGTFDPSPRC